jgi:hypothetical protein
MAIMDYLMILLSIVSIWLLFKMVGPLPMHMFEEVDKKATFGINLQSKARNIKIGLTSKIVLHISLKTNTLIQIYLYLTPIQQELLQYGIPSIDTLIFLKLSSWLILF